MADSTAGRTSVRPGARATDSNSFDRLSQEHLLPALAARRLGRDGPAIFIQAHQSPKYHVASAVLGTALAIENDARVVVYRFGRDDGRQRLRSRISKFLRRSAYGEAVQDRTELTDEWAHKFADEIIEIRTLRVDLQRADALVSAYVAADPTVADLERVAFDGTNVGEALIDKLVQKGYVKIDPFAPELLTMMRSEAARLSALERTIASRDVAAMVSIDIAYAPGLSLRLALKRGIDAFVAHHRQFIRLTPERPYSGLQSLDFPRVLDSLAPASRRALRREGDRFLEGALRTQGTGFTASKSRVWSDEPSEFLHGLDRRDRPVVLVTAHSFYDAQHAGGCSLFSDFYSWFEHLHGLSDRTNHLWLIKLHPDARDTGIGVRAATERLFADRANVVVLPEDVTQRQLLDFGIDVVHTIYGTAAMEFPYLGVGAITARLVSTHTPFSYAIVPTSVEELDRMLLDPGTWTYRIDRDGLLEYAALQYLGRRVALGEILSAPPGGSVDDFPWSDDWMSMVTKDSFQAGLHRFREWIASGDHSAAHWLGRQQLFERLGGIEATDESLGA